MDKMSVLTVGTGEYTTGYVPGTGAAADKRAGVVGVTLFDKTYRDMDVRFDSFPADDIRGDTCAYRTALGSLRPGDCVIVFTPDDTHSSIASLDAQGRTIGIDYDQHNMVCSLTAQ